MTRSFSAHFDGTVIIPDEPVDLPVNVPLRITFTKLDASHEVIETISVEERLRRIEKTIGGVSVPPVPLESMRREELYDE